MSGTSDEGTPRKPVAGELHDAQERLLLALTVIGVLALLVFLLVALQSPGKDTLSFEAGKAALQVLAVTVLGGVVGFVTFEYQQSHAKLADEERKSYESDLKNAEARRIDVANARDKRERQDAVLRELLEETVVAYNSVKRERRLLRASAKDGISLADYDSFAVKIIDLQLGLELNKRLVSTIGDERLLGSDRSHDEVLQEAYSNMDQYLGTIVSEYEEKRESVAAAGTDRLPLAQLPALDAFLAPARSSDFREKISEPLNRAVDVLREALRKPLVLPDGPVVPGTTGPGHPPA